MVADIPGTSVKVDGRMVRIVRSGVRVVEVETGPVMRSLLAK
jgi:hypothetical protein